MKPGRPRSQGPICAWGHPWTRASTYLTAGGTKVCRICRARAKKKYKEKVKQLQEEQLRFIKEEMEG